MMDTKEIHLKKLFFCCQRMVTVCSMSNNLIVKSDVCPPFTCFSIETLHPSITMLWKFLEHENIALLFLQHAKARNLSSLIPQGILMSDD
jgi:hypothetical protein